MEVLYNSVECLSCGEVLVTRYRHDFKQCSCDNGTFIDGGRSLFSRLGGKDLNNLKHFTVTSEDPFELQREYFEWGTRGKDGNEELKWVKLRDMSIEHIEAVKGSNNIFEKELKYREENGIY